MSSCLSLSFLGTRNSYPLFKGGMGGHGRARKVIRGGSGHTFFLARLGAQSELPTSQLDLHGTHVAQWHFERHIQWHFCSESGARKAGLDMGRFTWPDHPIDWPVDREKAGRPGVNPTNGCLLVWFHSRSPCFNTPIYIYIYIYCR